MRIKGADLEDEFLLQILAAADSHVFFGNLALWNRMWTIQNFI